MSLWDIINSDLDNFLDLDGFGKVALLNGLTNIVVQFFNEYDNAIRDESGIVSSTPFAIARSSDMAGVEQGDVLKIDGITYTITNLEPDGTGVTTLRLSR